MHCLKIFPVVLFLLLTDTIITAAQSVAPDPQYIALKSGDALQDRNFYLLTLMEKMPVVTKLLIKDPALQKDRVQYKKQLLWLENDQDIAAATRPFVLSGEMANSVGTRFQALLDHRAAPMQELLNEMRRSGMFQLYAALPDNQLLQKAWEDAAKGISYIINAYTTNKGFRYPKIDSAAYYVKSPQYIAGVHLILKELAQKKYDSTLIFRPALDLALGLLRLNRHDESIRYEPLSHTNWEAYTQLKDMNWNDYTFSAMLILGAGPSDKSPISESGKNRCRMGAELFKKGLAPCIIVSGGHVHPFGTPYAEAVEMKKFLVDELKIPASAVFIDPYARHTTTNIRNAVRIAWYSGIPLNKRMLCVSDALHLNYVNSKMFGQRATEELGYIPATDIKQSDLYFLSFLPDLRSLQADARDPLDP
ncbi:MAG TPA: YdcF family protein [Chitinophaga sp.]|uniref:YdcF family protein n=1 Tax=Chitinophaga sp. TaxID=1869181 RepID=UPI002BC49D0C|nr:YdcF family protein [Chitinophaga sp.]HVI46284.1 YdcF family protein [Chitinophaga sp.]